MRLRLTLVLAILAFGVAMVGYRTGRSGFALPAWVPPQASTVLSSLLPPRPPTSPAPSTADLTAYEFRLVGQSAKVGAAVIAVELMHKATGRPVPDAVLFAGRIDMAPDGMPTMTAPLDPADGGAPGTYRFRTNLAMAGGWQVSLAAKVPGEAGTVQGRLVLKAVQ